MTRIVLTAALLVGLMIGAAHADFAEDARNHGYNSGAYEHLCADKLVLTDAKLRAELDRRYRATPQFRETYAAFTERAAIVARKGWTKTADIACAVAGRAPSGGRHWLAPSE
jgi:hypothetical protein